MTGDAKDRFVGRPELAEYVLTENDRDGRYQTGIFHPARTYP